MLIRPATVADLPAVAALYGHEASTGVATFDTEPRPVEAWRTRLESVETGDHLLVAEVEGAVVGYANSASYRPKAAYARTREVSVYVGPHAQGRGAGSALYDELLGLLRTDGIHRAVAVIALPNDASLALHRRHGFSSVGVLHEVGHKFGRWIDTEIVQLSLD